MLKMNEELKLHKQKIKEYLDGKEVNNV